MSKCPRMLRRLDLPDPTGPGDVEVEPGTLTTTLTLTGPQPQVPVLLLPEPVPRRVGLLGVSGNPIQWVQFTVCMYCVLVEYLLCITLNPWLRCCQAGSPSSLPRKAEPSTRRIRQPYESGIGRRSCNINNLSLGDGSMTRNSSCSMLVSFSFYKSTITKTTLRKDGEKSPTPVQHHDMIPDIGLSSDWKTKTPGPVKLLAD
jgi:hypothetical protein